MSEDKKRSCHETEALPDLMEAGAQQAGVAGTEAFVPIDATISTPFRNTASSRPTVVGAERLVRGAGQTEPVDAEYELIRVLGRGGMGVVYQARQASIGRSVAVKMLNPAIDDNAKLQQKFVEEAAVTGELDHPNIVPIYDLGRTAQGLLFYAMKEVRGIPWKAVLHDRTVTENLHILLRVADAVAFAHSRGVVHRDLKPENIMLGEFGEVLVMDWGLALVDSAKSSASIGGTPCYMAPEMVTGPTSAIGAHSDIYLLGGILYEIVTGTPPHMEENSRLCLQAAARNEITPTTATGELVDIARRCLATQPADRFPSVQEFQAALRGFESHLESIAASVRARDGSVRAQQVGDYDGFAQALFGFQNALDLWNGNMDARAGLCETRVAYAEAALLKGDYELGLSIIAADTDENAGLRQRLLDAQREQDGRQQRLRSLRRTALSLGAGLVVVMAVALVWIMKAERRTREQRDIARVQQQLARDAVDQMLTEVGQQELEDVPQMESVRRNLLKKALDFYLRFLAEQPDDPSVLDETAQAYHRVGGIAKMLGQQREADDAYNRAIVLFEQLVSAFPHEPAYRQHLANSQNFLGELYRTQGDSKKAEQHYLRALDRQRTLVEHSPLVPVYRQELARTSYNLGLLYRSVSRPEEARQAYDNAIEELKKLSDSRDRDEENQQGLARAYLNRGILNREAGRLEEARQDYDGAIALLRALTESSPNKAEFRSELATVLNNLGNLLLPDQSRRAEAEKVYRDGLALSESLTRDFPGVMLYRKDLANSINSLAALYYYDQDFDAAERMWKRSRELARELVKDQPRVLENHSVLGRTLGNLGSLMFKRQDYEAARSFLSEAIASQHEALATNPDHPELRTFLRNYTWSLTEALLALKDHAAAAATAEQLPEILRDDPGELYRAAALMARCVPLVTEASDGQQPATISAGYAARATELLSRAVDLGFSDATKLDADEAFASIRATMPFIELRRRLEPAGKNDCAVSKHQPAPLVAGAARGVQYLPARGSAQLA